MSLNTVSTGNTILAADVNQLVNVLQRASGQTEVGKYLLNGWGSAASDFISQYMTSLSRVSVPVSVTLDEADIAHTNCNAVSNDTLTANGFHVFTTTTAATTNARVAGNATINF